MVANKILIIDCDLVSRNYLATALEKKGYQTLQAASGREGLVAAWRDRPTLVIADPVMADIPGEELAARLRGDARTAQVRLIALSSDPKPGRQQACMEAGFQEYLVKGPQAVSALMEAVAQSVPRGATAAKGDGLSIAFLSAKGGTGTSSVCANIAMNIAQIEPNCRVVVADLVLPIGSIAGIVGYGGERNLVTIARMPASETTPEFLGHNLPRLDGWRLHLLAGSPDPERANELQVERIQDLVPTLQGAYDFVLLDVGRSLSRISLPLIEQADLIGMILAPDLTTVALTKTVLDFLEARGVQPASVFLIMNRAVGLEGLTKAEAEKTLGVPIRTAIPYLGPSLSLANSQHQPYSLKFEGDAASIILKDIAQQMVADARRLRAASGTRQP